MTTSDGREEDDHDLSYNHVNFVCTIIFLIQLKDLRSQSLPRVFPVKPVPVVGKAERG